MNEHIKNLQGLILALETRRVEALKIPNSVEITSITDSIDSTEKLILNLVFIDNVRSDSDEK